MSVEIKIIAADADSLADQLLKVIKALGINARAEPQPEMSLSDLKDKAEAALNEQGFEMTVTERDPLAAAFPEPEKPKNKGGRPASLDRETAAKQLKAKTAPAETKSGPDADADKTFVLSFLKERFQDYKQKAAVQEFIQAVHPDYKEHGISQLDAARFPAIRKKMEKEFGLT